jgi:hypothetical protein
MLGIGLIYLLIPLITTLILSYHSIKYDPSENLCIIVDKYPRIARFFLFFFSFLFFFLFFIFETLIFEDISVVAVGKISVSNFV